MINVAVLGHGVVGSGTVEVFDKNIDKIKRLFGVDAKIKTILDLREFPDSPYAEKFTKNFDDILNDSEIDIVAEVMGGLHPAYDFVDACLKAGKSVVTSNKELVASKGAELLKTAKENSVNFLFEASVGGGIPIIRPLHRCLIANEVEEVAGILNGTTNFILTKMFVDNMRYDDALSLAQELGYAERDPSADVDGLDACRKIAILGSMAFGRHIYPDSVKTEGIREISIEDVKYADSWGGKIKLIGWAKREGDKVLTMVCPAFVKNSSQLASVSDVYNAVLVRGSETGDTVFYGKGAGKNATASAVVADILDVIAGGEISKTLTWEDSEQDFIENPDNATLGKYIRVKTDKPEEIEKIFGEVQMLKRRCQPKDEFAFVVGEATATETDVKIDKLTQNGAKILSQISILNY